MSERIGTFELRPQYDGHKSFYGKAVVEQWTYEKGMFYELRSYGHTVATVTPISDWGYEVKVAMGLLSATTLRHVKEFLAQTDDVFRGITLDWLRKAVKDGRQIDGAVREPVCRKLFVIGEL